MLRMHSIGMAIYYQILYIYIYIYKGVYEYILNIYILDSQRIARLVIRLIIPRTYKGRSVSVIQCVFQLGFIGFTSDEFNENTIQLNSYMLLL